MNGRRASVPHADIRGLSGSSDDDVSPHGVINRRTPIEALPEFLSPEEFRAYMGIGRSTVYDLLRRDELPHVRFGRCIRIPKAVLQKFAAGVE